ncbi:DNA primase family protein [Jongsikchunia kroppenstedtii]|uniref:DNA primase family protein n=1 Tax=Jongsikchunia kroppenstedtii TaxID=1121721 RepID=UPI0003790FD5|nr:DNA primase family protein [Jongsikchunia kroppenstedtii]
MKLPTELQHSLKVVPLELRDEHNRLMLDDSPLSAFLAQRLRPVYRFVPGLGWHRYNGKVWRNVADDRLTEEVQKQLTDLFALEATQADSDRRKRLAGLLSSARVRAVKGLLRGLLLEDAGSFDSVEHAHLLNCRNGVLDLRTGELRPHDPDLLFTKLTRAAYVPDARHPDWDEALRALPDEQVRQWLQTKLGQAATGQPPTDDVLPVLFGDGSNGKSTVLAFRYALGDYANTVPERLLTARPSDHPTELTTLRGLRCGVLEELPEGVFSVRRLKALLGTSEVSARKTGQDNITWSATHSLVISTNYRPRVLETDHGTWRRLALVTFPLRYLPTDKPLERENDRHGQAGLRERLERGREQQEAVLAWLVEGARRVYDGTDEQQVVPLPARVQLDTTDWRNNVDLLALFAESELAFDAASSVLSRDLFDEFTKFLASHGHAKWSDQTFTEKLATHDLAHRHGLTKTRTRPKQLSWPSWQKNPTRPKDKVSQWHGVRFRTAEDDLDE